MDYEVGDGAVAVEYGRKQFRDSVLSVLGHPEIGEENVSARFYDTLQSFLSGEDRGTRVDGLDRVQEAMENGFQGSVTVYLYPDGANPLDQGLLDEDRAVRLQYNAVRGRAVFRVPDDYAGDLALDGDLDGRDI